MNIFNCFKKMKKTCIDFSTGLNLMDLPIVTFTHGEQELNFLLDTGSNKSLINASVINKLNHIPLQLSSTMFGVDGNYTKVGAAIISIFYNGKEYANDFMISDLDKPFSNIKEETGITIHGILGINFFKKHKSVFDFGKMKIYFNV